MSFKSSVLLLVLALTGVKAAVSPRDATPSAFLRIKGGSYDLNGLKNGLTIFQASTNITSAKQYSYQDDAGNLHISSKDNDGGSDDSNNYEETESAIESGSFNQCQFAAICATPLISSNDTYCTDDSCSNCCIVDSDFLCNHQTPSVCLEGTFLSPFGTCNVTEFGVPDCSICCIEPDVPIDVLLCSQGPSCEAPFEASGDVNCTSTYDCLNCCAIDPLYECAYVPEEYCTKQFGEGSQVATVGFCQVHDKDCSNCCVPFGTPPPPPFTTCDEAPACEAPFIASGEVNCTDETCQNCCVLDMNYVCLYTSQSICPAGQMLLSGICGVKRDYPYLGQPATAPTPDCANCCVEPGTLGFTPTCALTPECGNPQIRTLDAFCNSPSDCSNCCEINPTYDCSTYADTYICAEGLEFSSQGVCGVSNVGPDCSNCCVNEMVWDEEETAAESATFYESALNITDVSTLPVTVTDALPLTGTEALPVIVTVTELLPVTVTVTVTTTAAR